MTPEQLYENLILTSEVDSKGNKFWYNSEQQHHRIYGPASEFADGSRKWFQNGKLHREDGPAVEYTDGRKIWFQNGKLHRENGPAVELPSGRKEYWINGVFIGKS